MAYLIDGHNLIPKIPGLTLRLEDDEARLVELLQHYCRVRNQSVDVYFDQAAAGQSGTRRFGKVTAHFVNARSSADAAIGLRLKKLGGSARNWKVVSSDRQVQAEARNAGAGVVKSEAFANDLIEAQRETPPDDPGKGAALSPGEVDEWLEMFRRGKPKADG
jgi:predicted RNA-binding protein with PIN domain